jgi:Family of unknown function (DUF6455)
MTQVRLGADQSTAALEPRYRLFRRKGQPDLFCAVPEDHPVPGFITGGCWAFAGTRDSNSLPPGMSRTAAELGVRFNGFHLFQGADPLRRTAGQSGRMRDLLLTHRRHGLQSLVEVTMKGFMKRRVEQQSRNMAAMMVHLDAGVVAAARDARGAEFAAATARCLICTHSLACDGWLADPNRGSDAPSFCPNARFFARHGLHGQHGGPRDTGHRAIGAGAEYV